MFSNVRLTGNSPVKVEFIPVVSIVLGKYIN